MDNISLKARSKIWEDCGAHTDSVSGFAAYKKFKNVLAFDSHKLDLPSLRAHISGRMCQFRTQVSDCACVFNHWCELGRRTFMLMVPGGYGFDLDIIAGSGLVLALGFTGVGGSGCAKLDRCRTHSAVANMTTASPNTDRGGLKPG